MAKLANSLRAFGQSFYRELWRISKSKWDFSLVFVLPLLIIVLFGAMFYQGKAKHLPVAIIDQDHSQLSAMIAHHIHTNENVHIVVESEELSHAYQALNQLTVGGYIYIPSGAQTRLVRGEDSRIQIAYNQSFFSIGTGVNSALSSSSKTAIKEFLSQAHFSNLLPHSARQLPTLKASLLFNPQMSNELFLEPFLVPAVLHLLLCCLVAYAIGSEFKHKSAQTWLGNQPISALLGKLSIYQLVIFCYSVLWLMWLTEIRGWQIAGSLALLLLAYWLFYLSYTFFGALVVLRSQDANKSFGLLAIYGGSSMSFAGVSLPLNNAPRFTQIWSEIIPFTSFARLQTQTWVVGSPMRTSLPNLYTLILFVLIFGALSLLLVKKAART